MNNREFDIENTFNKAFGSFNYKVNNDVWNNIETELNETFPETVYNDYFSNFKMTPDNSNWKKIATVLWFEQFLSFSVKTFNIYYLIALLSIMGASVYNFISSPKQQYIARNLNIKTIKDNGTQKIINTNNDKFNEDNINTNKINNSYLTDNDTSKTTNKKDNSASLQKINKQKDSKIYNNSLDKNIQNNDLAKNNQDVKIKYITKYIKDTVVIRDTLKMYITDTVYKQKQEISKPKTVTPWSVGIFFEPLANKSLIAGDNSLYASNINPEFSWSAGLNLNYSFKNFNIQTGLAYTRFSEQFSYSKEETSINRTTDKQYIRTGTHKEINKYTIWEITDYETVLKYDSVPIGYEIVQKQENNTTVIDTIWHYVVDTVYKQIPVDSVESVRYDTIMVVEYDSVDVVIIDTVKKRTIYDVINRYSYMEIPLTFGYEFKTKGKLSYTVSGGILTGLFINAQGKGVTLKDEIVDLEHLPFLKINLSGVFALGVNYNLSKEFSLQLNGTYRQNFTSVYQQDYFLSQRFNAFGIRFGLMYKF